jgi:hypothetical protein
MERNITRTQRTGFRTFSGLKNGKDNRVRNALPSKNGKYRNVGNSGGGGEAGNNGREVLDVETSNGIQNLTRVHVVPVTTRPRNATCSE